MTPLPHSHLPPDLSTGLRALGTIWANSEYRPKLPWATKAHWDTLLNEWMASDLPLAIRKSSGVRGSMVSHSSGRRLVVCDNSPAQWAFSRAYEGHLYSLDDIRALLEADKLPFTFATKTAEKPHMCYRCTLRPPDSLGKRGWKLCHMQGVGLSTKTPIEQLPLERLLLHFTRLMAPSNHFLVPLQWAGLGEIPEFIGEVEAIEAP